MQTKHLLVGLIFFAVAAGEILLLRRRNGAKVVAGTMTVESARQQMRYQWKMLVGLILISAVLGIGVLFNLL